MYPLRMGLDSQTALFDPFEICWRPPGSNLCAGNRSLLDEEGATQGASLCFAWPPLVVLGLTCSGPRAPVCDLYHCCLEQNLGASDKGQPPILRRIVSNLNKTGKPTVQNRPANMDPYHRAHSMKGP
jgi:hypothetical protein